MTIKTIQFFPLQSNLHKPYGSSRGIVSQRSCTVIKITDVDGITGYGEAFGPPLAIEEILNVMKMYFLNKDPFSIPNLMTRILNEQYHTASKGLLVCALSGVEMAVWDLLGKIIGKPVYQLLGGRVRDYLVPYASTGYFTEEEHDEDLSRQVEEIKVSNFKALKIKIGRNIKSDIKRVEYVRSKLPDIQIMVDMNGNYTADIALKVMDCLKDYNIYWFEEPLPPQDIKGYEILKSAHPSAIIAIGEAEYTRYGFRDLIQEHLVDIVQPDLTKCGGITEAKAITYMAQANNVRISPHIWGGMIGRAATAHFMLSIPYYPHSLMEPEPLYMEYDLGHNPLRDDIGITSVFRNHEGNVEVRNNPGFGVEVDEEMLQFYQISRERV